MPQPPSEPQATPTILRIVAFLRPVHNPAFSIEPAQVSKFEELPGYRPMPDPLSEIALEGALGLRDSSPEPATVIACSAGGTPCQAALREALACGADEALWIHCSTGEPDAWIVAAHLSAFFRHSRIGLALFGARDLDTGAGAVGPMFSALAGLPFLDGVTGLKWTGGGRLEATRSRGSIRERIRLTLPACVSIHRGPPLRYPTLEGKIRSERTPLQPCAVDPGPVAPSLERERFSPPKPARASAAADYAKVSSLDRIRQAYGMSGSGQKAAGSQVLRLPPDEASRKILQILKEEGFLDPGRAEPRPRPGEKE